MFNIDLSDIKYLHHKHVHNIKTINTFFPYIALISAFAAQMALLGFIFSLSLSLTGTCHLMVEDYSHACQRDRGKKKEEEKSPEKTLCRDRDLNPRTLSPEPSMFYVRPRRPAPKLLIPHFPSSAESGPLNVRVQTCLYSFKDSHKVYKT